MEGGRGRGKGRGDTDEHGRIADTRGDLTSRCVRLSADSCCGVREAEGSAESGDGALGRSRTMRLEPDVPSRDRRDALGNAPPRTPRAKGGLARARTRTSYCLTPVRVDASCVAIPSVIHAACPPMATGARRPRELTVFLVPGDAKPSRSRARVTPSTDPTPPFAIEPVRADASPTRAPFGSSRTASCAAREACDGPRRRPFVCLQAGGWQHPENISHDRKMRIKSDADRLLGRVREAKGERTEHPVSSLRKLRSKVYSSHLPAADLRGGITVLGERVGPVLPGF